MNVERLLWRAYRRIKYQAFRFCWRHGLKSWALWFLIDRSPPTTAEIAYGQKLWAEIEARERG